MPGVVALRFGTLCTMSDALASQRSIAQWVGLFAGPVLALVCFALLPASYLDAQGQSAAFTVAGRATLAVMVWMATWWLTEAINISATALLPLAVFPLLGIADIASAASPYAKDLIFLFMGGFMLALSMQRWGLDRRIALITLRIVGTQPRMMIAGFMIATALLSAFVSNTATAAMMLPIGVSVIDLVLRQTTGSALTQSGSLPGAGTPGRNFAICLMLGIAYAASIGGIATIIGTPPNIILVAFVRDTIAPEYRREIGFAEWLKIGVPLVVVFLPLVWALLTYVIYPVRIKRIEGGSAMIHDELRKLGRVKPGEWITFFVFLVAAMLWITRPWLAAIEFERNGHALRPFAGLTDAGIAMGAAMLLFVIPTNWRTRTFTLNWETASRLPWGILILFGGGLSLAVAVESNGVAQFLASYAHALEGAPTILIVIAVVTAVIFLTELTSNTATTATLVPILAAIAPAMGVHPYLLIFGCAIAASCAFMMPIATPPNAIVFGSGYLTIPQMCKAGLWLNIAGIVLVTLLIYVIVLPSLAQPS